MLEQSSEVSGFNVLDHHCGELFVRNLAITVGINLLDDLVDDCLVKGLTEGENLLDLIGRDGTTTVLVEHLECSVQLVVAQEALLVHGGHHKLRVVDLSISIGINLGKHIVNLLVRETLSEVFFITVLDFLL